MKDDQKGYIVVETAMAFTLFVFFVTSILTLINVVAVQARVHHAVSQAAIAVSMYDYSFHVAGLDDDIVTIVKQADELKSDYDSFMGNVDTVMDSLDALSQGDVTNVDISGAEGAAGEAYDQASQWVDTAVNDPKTMVKSLLGLAANEASKEAFGALVRPVVGRYLTNGSQSGDEYLKSMRVVDGLDGLDLTPVESDSAFLDADGNVVITVSYQIDFGFGALPLPFTELNVVQTVKTKAWLGGAGDGYSG